MSDTTSQPRSRWIGVTIRLAITIAIGIAIFTVLPARSIVDAMQRTGLTVWGTVLVCFAFGHLVSAQKWRLLVRASGTPISAWLAIRAHGAGLFANIWLPSIVGGDVVRAGIVARENGSLAGPAAAGIADRVLDMTSVLVLAALGMFLAPVVSQGPAATILQLGALAVFGGTAVAWFALRNLAPERLPSPLQHPFARLKEAAEPLFDAGSTAAIAAAMSFAVQFAFVALNAWIASAIGIDAPFSVWLLAWPLAKIAALLPVSLGGLGVREVALASLLLPFGVDPTVAVAQALVWQSILFSLGLLAGAVSLGVVRRWRSG